MNVNIRTKLTGSFALILMMLIVIGLIAILKMSALQNSVSVVQGNWLPSINKIGVIKDNYSDIRALLNGAPLHAGADQRANLQQDLQDAEDAVSQDLKAYETLINSPEEKAIYTALQQHFQDYTAEIPAILEAAGQTGEAAKTNGLALLDKAEQTNDQIAADFKSWISYNNDGAKQEVEHARDINSNAKTLVLTIGLVALAAGIALALYISGNLTKSLRSILLIVTKAAEGDLRENAEVRSRDEIGTLAIAFNTMLNNLRTLIGQTLTASQNVAVTAREISATTEEIAGGSASQAESAQTIQELVREMSIALGTVASNTSAVAELSEQAQRGAEEGGEAIQSSISGMARLSDRMQLLEQDSHTIGQIIEVINEIAEQTNLLALNAAIEAARAGDQGRGFAVVADEVRKLAERSGEATKQIGAIIKGMQQNTDLSVKAVQEASALSSSTGAVFGQIVGMVAETARQAADIAAASEQQSAQTEEVMRSVEAIAAASEESAAAAEQTASSSQTLAALSADLNQHISIFSV